MAAHVRRRKRSAPRERPVLPLLLCEVISIAEYADKTRYLSAAGSPPESRDRKADTPVNLDLLLHVTHASATPAGEPFPIGIDIVSGAIVEADVKQRPAASASFRAFARI